MMIKKSIDNINMFLKFTGLPAATLPIKSPATTGSILKLGAKKHLGPVASDIKGIEMSFPFFKSLLYKIPSNSNEIIIL